MRLRKLGCVGRKAKVNLGVFVACNEVKWLLAGCGFLVGVGSAVASLTGRFLVEVLEDMVGNSTCYER